MRLNDTQQEKYEALAEAIGLCLEPLVKVAVGRVGLERAEDQATLALMKLVDDAYKQGARDEHEYYNPEKLTTTWRRKCPSSLS